jgi:hypothetical protein
VPQQDNKNNRSLMQYAALGGQLTVGLLLAVWLGKKLDGRLNFSTPFLIWLFPLLVITALIIKIVKDTLHKK